MKTSTAIVLGVVVLAGVGGFIYWQHSKAKIAAAHVQQPKSTTDKVVGTISSLIPLGSKIAQLWES